MFDPRRDMQHLAFAHRDLLAADQEPERALQNVGHLLALVGVHRNDAAGLQIDLSQHLALARDDFSGEHLGHLLEGDFVPAMKSNDLGGHDSGSIYHPREPIEQAATGSSASLESIERVVNAIIW